jgi:hypothetical protein
MRKIHPRTAAAIFVIIYYFIGLLIYLIFKINLFKYIIYIVIAAIGALIIHIIFEKDYYDNK